MATKRIFDNISKCLVRLIKKKENKEYINNIKNNKVAITTNPTDI